ncbi:hypothetical protein BT69DRAFT_1210286 [Atractiella rhizophila]|nr:hypothetical protein BT69DRAFT_1210286 [Atractiella rhizophila]
MPKDGIPVFPYCPERFRFWIALLCARRKRPFSIVEDYEMKVIFKMLKPDVKIPSAKTVSDDVWMVYEAVSNIVKQELKVCFHGSPLSCAW